MENQNDESRLSDRRDENLEQLLEKFLGAEEGQKAAQEIRQGDKLFDLNPAPEPSESGIADIKARIAARLSRPRAAVYAASAYKLAAVAAAIIVWSWVALQFFELSRPETGMERTLVAESPRRTWSGWDETVADAELASFAEEIDRIESSIVALRLGEQDNANGAVLADIEAEMVEIDSFFWKG